MKFFSCIAAGAIAAAAVFSIPGTANTAPMTLDAFTIGKSDAAKARGGLVQKVYGCHKYPQNHMVYLWGYQAWHSHGYNCTPQAAPPPGYYPPKPPPGYYPQPVLPGPGYACHQNWQNHFHPGFGYGWHRHSRKNCAPRRGRQWRGGSKKGCVNIAGIWICG